MKIIKTDVLDRNIIQHNETSKILFANDLVEHFAPVFYEELRKKQEQISNNLVDITKLKTTITENRTKIIQLSNSIKVETVKNQILQEIQQLINIDVIYGKTKNLIQNIVVTLESQPLEALEKRLAFLQQATKEKLKDREK